MAKEQEFWLPQIVHPRMAGGIFNRLLEKELEWKTPKKEEAGGFSVASELGEVADTMLVCASLGNQDWVDA